MKWDKILEGYNMNHRFLDDKILRISFRLSKFDVSSHEELNLLIESFKTFLRTDLRSITNQLKWQDTFKCYILHKTSSPSTPIILQKMQKKPTASSIDLPNLKNGGAIGFVIASHEYQF
jgi:hypothetical protein